MALHTGVYDPEERLEEQTVLPIHMPIGQTWTPEQHLCRAILEDAAWCLTHLPTSSEQFQADWRWLHATDEDEGSLHWVCAALKIDDEWYVRAFLRAMARGHIYNKPKDRVLQNLRHAVHNRR